ncbi:MAG: phage tail protein [Burkholderiales bacterium]|nr:phage tail protein [Burkholderiales bacterium]
MGTPYMGELRIMSFNFAPKYWAQCNGQLLSIAQNQALFSLLGTTYGGNGVTNFALPDLRTMVPSHAGAGYVQGEILGEYSHTLLTTEIPQHLHFLKADATNPGNTNAATAVAGNSFGQTYGKPSSGSNIAFNMYSTTLTPVAPMAPQALGVAGGSQPHENRQPFLVLNICIALQGIFPSRN